jgi:hypothetical protein
LHDRKCYPRDFLLAVKKEGCVRINEPIEGRNYIRWMNDNRYAFADAPVGRRGEVLVPRRSCAISSRNRFLRRLEVMSGSYAMPERACMHPLQIDLFFEAKMNRAARSGGVRVRAGLGWNTRSRWR